MSSSFLIYEVDVNETEVDGNTVRTMNNFRYPGAQLAPSYEYLYGIPVHSFYGIQEPERVDIQPILLPTIESGKHHALARHSNLPNPGLLIPLTSKAFPIGFYGSVVHKDIFLRMINELQKHIVPTQKAEDFDAMKMITDRYRTFLDTFSYENTTALTKLALKQYYETLTPTPGQFLRNHAIDHTTSPSLSLLEHTFHVFKSQYADGIGIGVEVSIEGEVITDENIAQGQFSGVVSNQSVRTLTTPLSRSNFSLVKPLVDTPTDEQKNTPTENANVNDVKTVQTPETNAAGQVQYNSDGSPVTSGDAKSTMAVIPPTTTNITVDGKDKTIPVVSTQLTDNEQKREQPGDDGKNEPINHRNSTTIETGNETENKL